MSRFPQEFVPPKHNHLTRDIKGLGEGCPGCDDYWLKQVVKPRTVQPACPSCGRLIVNSPSAGCGLPHLHTAIPRNHGGLGRSPV